MIMAVLSNYFLSLPSRQNYQKSQFHKLIPQGDSQSPSIVDKTDTSHLFYNPLSYLSSLGSTPAIIPFYYKCKRNPVVIDMKNLRLIVIVVIFAIVSTPALAIPDFRAGAITWRQSLFESTIPTPTIPSFFKPLPEMKPTLPTIVVPTPTTTESEYDGDVIYDGPIRLFECAQCHPLWWSSGYWESWPNRNPLPFL